MPLYVEENKLGKLHWPLVLAVTAIAGVGVWNLASAGGAKFPDIWLQQLRWIILGVLIVGATLLIDYRVLKSLSWPLYLGALAMLLLVPIVGHKVYGAQRWLKFGPMTVQPSEFAKIAVILMLARYFDDYVVEPRVVRSHGAWARVVLGVRRLKERWTARKLLAAPPKPMTAGVARRISGYQLLDLWQVWLLLFVPVVVVIRQPDLGTGLVVMAVGGSMVLFAGLTRAGLAFVTVSGVVAAGLGWLFALKPYQKRRILNFLDPNHDA
jgi:rod shape determining protein RodA